MSCTHWQNINASRPPVDSTDEYWSVRCVVWVRSKRRAYFARYNYPMQRWIVEGCDCVDPIEFYIPVSEQDSPYLKLI